MYRILHFLNVELYYCIHWWVLRIRVEANVIQMSYMQWMVDTKYMTCWRKWCCFYVVKSTTSLKLLLYCCSEFHQQKQILAILFIHLQLWLAGIFLRITEPCHGSILTHSIKTDENPLSIPPGVLIIFLSVCHFLGDFKIKIYPIKMN